MSTETTHTSRWGARLLLLSGLILLVGLGALYIKRIDLAHWAIEQTAPRFGFDDYALKITRLGFSTSMIEDLRLSHDIKADKVVLNYSVLGLLKGKLTQVRLQGGTIDLSQPDQGALGQLQSLQNQTISAPSSPPPALPKIIITDLNVHLQEDDIAATATLDGTIYPDLSGSLIVNAAGSWQDVAFDKALSAVRLHTGAQSADITLTRLHISDQNPSPRFHDLKMSGSAKWKGQDLSYDMELRDMHKQVRVHISGQTNIVQQNGQAQITLEPVRFSPDGLQPEQLSALAALPNKLDLTIGGEASINWQDKRPEITGSLSLKDARFALPDALTRDITLSGDAFFEYLAFSEKLNLHSPALSLRHTGQNPLFTPLTLNTHVKLLEKQLSFDSAVFNSTAQPIKLLQAKGRIDITRRNGEAHLNIPGLGFTQNGFQPKDLSPILSILEQVSGDVKAQASLRLKQGDISASGHLDLDDVSLSTDTLLLEGLNTSFAFASLWPPRSEPEQTITLDRLSSGLSLGKPEIRISINQDQITLHQFQAQAIDGQVRVENVQIDPTAARHDVRLQLEQINLKKLFDLIALDGLSGTGKVSGTIPLSIEGQTIRVHDGLLESERPGTLWFRSQKARDALAGAGEQVDLLLKVLSNFHYNHLSLRLNQQAGGTAVVHLKIKGKNPDVKDGRPFHLNINLEGNLDRLLAGVLEGYRLSDRAIRATVGDRQ